MLLPKGNLLHKELNTSFTDFGSFIQQLRQNRFSGYVRLDYWQFEGLMVFDTGRIIQAHTIEKDKYNLGVTALLDMVERAREKDGSIDAHALSSEAAMAISEVLGAKLKKTFNISEENSFGDILKSLESDSFTGSLDIQFGEKKGFATIFILEGLAIESVLMSNTGKIMSGDKVYHKIVDLAGKINLTVKLYQNGNSIAIDEEKLVIYPETDDPFLKFWSDFLNFYKAFYYDTGNNNFDSQWKSVCKTEENNFRILHPERNNIKFDENNLQLNGIFQKSSFEQEITKLLNILFRKLSWKNRFRLKSQKLFLQFKEKYPINYSCIAEQKVKKLFNDTFDKK